MLLRRIGYVVLLLIAVHVYLVGSLFQTIMLGWSWLGLFVHVYPGEIGLPSVRERFSDIWKWHQHPTPYWPSHKADEEHRAADDKRAVREAAMKQNVMTSLELLLGKRVPMKPPEERTH